jgi:hypothetical protein
MVKVEAVADDGRLPGRHWPRMRPSPFDLQLRDIFGLDARLRLKARIVQIEAPAVPLRRFQLNGGGVPVQRFASRLAAIGGPGILPVR